MGIMRDIKQRKRLNWITFSTGYLILTEFSATGGVKYSREGQRIRKGSEGSVTELTVRQIADNRDLLRESKSLINAAAYVVDQFCAKTPLGYFTDDTGLLRIKQDLIDLQEGASKFNEIAGRIGSERRVWIEAYPVAYRLDDPAVGARMAVLIRERLEDLSAALLAGDKAAFLAAMDAARNLDKLVQDPHRLKLVEAVNWAKLRRQELGRLLREGLSPKDAAKVLDVSAIVEAAALFEEPRISQQQELT